MTAKRTRPLPQRLTARGVARAALKHWDRLGAVCGEDECRYDYGNGHRCVIGNAMSRTTLARVRQVERGTFGVPLQVLLDAKVVRIEEADRLELIRLQELHDRVPGVVAFKGPRHDISLRERRSLLAKLRRACQRLAKAAA